MILKEVIEVNGHAVALIAKIFLSTLRGRITNPTPPKTQRR
jgi:hypothetical protein